MIQNDLYNSNDNFHLDSHVLHDEPFCNDDGDDQSIMFNLEFN